ncbi:phage terminase large subunit [Burkholderia metallica]|uniref:phage terminase large subunit n=1 Tax=Burkholderia metallica TaxID=488729 RepID=UPI001CF44206|nr:phage terminase large subunit [Burkholderia metallica]MCA8018082.1 phage terminase large subunit [Burkholderia metallica]
MAEFKLTDKQAEAQEVLNGPATHVMLAGGSRSGKTFLTVRKIVQRALKAPGSRHAILRFRLGHVKQSVMMDTFPTVMSKCFPGVEYDLNRSDLMFATMPGGSEIWFGGLDDKQRVEKILGNEYASIFLNECSQIAYDSRNMAVTRLAQKVTDRATGMPLRLKMYYDENPPDKGHWTYKMFKLLQDPETRQPLDPNDYAFYRINPGDNQENLSAAYIKTLEALPERLRKRFLYGDFRDSAPNALFRDEWLEKWRNIDGELPDMLRIVVAVDPSGADDDDNIENDEIGIIVAGLGIDGNGYVLEDLTCKAGPGVWGKVATTAFERWDADRIVAEQNFGGAMVKFVIRAARPNTPFRPVTASRGKVVRAEPVSALVESGRVRMAGVFRELEDELCAFTTHGYMGENSPNRADAFVWAMSDLFPELTKHEDKPVEKKPQLIVRRGSGTGWMRTL